MSPLLSKHELDILDVELEGQPGTFAACRRVGVAMHRFVWAVADALRMPQFLDWLARKMSRDETKQP